MPALGFPNTSVSCRDIQAIGRLDADTMRAVRQCGRLRVGDAVYPVAWDTGAGAPGPLVAAPPRGSAHAALRVQALLHRRERELAGNGGEYANVRRLRQVCELASAGAPGTFPELRPLKDILAAGAGELRCGRHRYAVAVHVHKGDVSVTVRRTDLARNRGIRFVQAVLDMFRRGSVRSRAAMIGATLTGLARSRWMVAEQAVPAPCNGADGASVGPAAETPAKARARAALEAIRTRVRLANWEKGTSSELPKNYPKVDLGRIGPADMDWSGIDLSRLDLSGTNLKRFNLSGANLRGSLLYCCNLSGAVLANADLHKADLDHANLTGANLVGATLANTSLKGSKLGHANLAGADLTSADVDFRTDFSDCCLIDADLSGQYLLCTHLARADLTRAKLDNARLLSANLRGARLVGASLIGADLEDAEFAQADLRGARLRNVTALRGDFLKAVFDGGGRDISLNTWSLTVPDHQERYLNHQGNTTSLQQNIDAIGDDALKLRLMQELVQSVQNSPIARLMDGAPATRGAYLSMLDVLSGNPLYCRNDPAIAALVNACRQRDGCAMDA